jgi:methylmalonyl-CoA/ethylmalonyl-CoA epimerase
MTLTFRVCYQELPTEAIPPTNLGSDTHRRGPKETDVRFDHIGIIVADLPAGLQMLRDQFAVAKWTHPFSDPVNDVHVQFGCDAAGTCYELIAPFSKNSPVWRSLRTGNNITNHVAYIVADLSAARDKLLAADFSPVSDPNPAVAYGGANIQFFMSPIFSLVELIEAPGHQHQYQDDGTHLLTGAATQ